MNLQTIFNLSLLEQLQLGVVLGLLLVEHIIRSIIFTVWSLFPSSLLNWIYSKVYIISSLFALELNSEKYDRHYDMRYQTVNTEYLVNQMGYTCIDYYSKTEDGYILCLHRISKDHVKGKCPILIVHGLMMSDETFVYSEEVSMVKPLVEAGFDIWLGNCRANKYSWRHETLKRESKQYWDFSIDEIGRYDIPALVRCVLQMTNFEKLIFIGFSNGAGSFIAALQHDHNLKNKIRHFIGVAPACKVKALNKGAQSFGFVYPMFFSPNSDIFFSCFGERAMIPSNDQWKRILNPAMYTKLIDICMLSLFGWKFDSELVPYERKSKFFFHLYSTTSVKIVHHWFQVIGQQRFDRYKSKSVFLGDIQMPVYNVSLINSIPFTGYIGADDLLTDYDWMKEAFPNAILNIIPNYKHLDFLCSSDVSELVLEPMVKTCELAAKDMLSPASSEYSVLHFDSRLSTTEGIVDVPNFFV